MPNVAYTGITSATSSIERAFDAGKGIVRLAPAWVPRSFCTPGKRIRLHPDDYYPFGDDRGGIDERWLASAVRADNGPLTGEHEGLSLVVDLEGGLIPFDEFVAHHGSALIGSRLWNQYRLWPMYSKFFDNQAPLPLHIHHRDEHAALVDKPGKPEAYYYPPQMNNHLGELGLSFLGLNPETTKSQVIEKLRLFGAGGDNRITELSRGYRTQLGTGWDIPGGVLHAPASVCTYEPQAACDVFAMTESWSNHREVHPDLLWKDVPADRRGDLNFIVELLDWEKNIDPYFLSNRFMAPLETTASVAEADAGYIEKWVVYRSTYFSAKELTVAPGATVTVSEQDAYGLIVVQGHGSFGQHPIAAATTIRYGQLSSDEFFVSADAARHGVTITNASATDDIVILKHFGPGNEQLAADAGLIPTERK